MAGAEFYMKKVHTTIVSRKIKHSDTVGRPLSFVMETFWLFGLFTLSTNLQRIMNITLVISNFDFRNEEVDLEDENIPLTFPSLKKTWTVPGLFCGWLTQNT